MLYYVKKSQESQLGNNVKITSKLFRLPYARTTDNRTTTVRRRYFIFRRSLNKLHTKIIFFVFICLFFGYLIVFGEEERGVCASGNREGF